MKPIKKRVGFFLQKRKKWDGKRDFERPVVLSFNYHGKRLYMLTGVKVSENNWDDKKHRVKLAVNRAGEINDYLQRLDDKLNDAYYERLATGEEITNGYILDRLKNREKQEAKKSFWEHYEAYIQVKKTNTKHGNYKAMMTGYNAFKTFSTSQEIDVTLDSVDAKLLSQYNDYLLSVKRNNNNTVSSQIKRLKRFLNAAEKQGLHKNQKYKDYTVRETTSKHKFLNSDEVRSLIEVNLTSESEQRVRDIMVVGCYTGMRYDDIKNFKKADIKEHRFEGIPEAYKAAHIRDGKTSGELIVPLLPVVLTIIKKYEDQPTKYALPHLSLKTFNEVIKNVAKKAKLNSLQKIDTFRGATLETKYVERWRIISSHYCRHTFITFCASSGIPINVVASITGQHPSTIIKHYLGVLGPEKFKAMSEKLKF